MNEVELLMELVKINSENPPGNEREIAFFIKDFLEDLRIPCRLMKFGENRYNLIAFVGMGDGLMLNGHMDTVPVGNIENWKYDPFGKMINGKIYGRGAVDMKGGLVSMLTAVKNVVKDKAGFKRKLLLAFVGDEEVALGGSKFFIKNGRKLLWDVKYGVIGEPTAFMITRAQKGIANMRVKIKGKAAHGSSPELGDNAIYKACDMIQEIRKLIKGLKKKNDNVLGSGTINIGKMVGGIKVNIVPDYCEVDIDRRIIPGETPALARKQINDILKKLKIKAEIEALLSRLPMKIPEDSELIKMLKVITRTRTRGTAGYTEAELYYRDCGIECVICGPGKIGIAHTVNEYMEISALKKGVIMFEKLIKKWCC